MEIMGLLVYLGGVQAAPDEWGFWKTVLWPYHFGKALMDCLVRETQN